MLAWLALLYALCVFALLGWWRGRHRVRTMASPAAIRHANVHANLLALVWAALPILLVRARVAAAAVAGRRRWSPACWPPARSC